MKLLKPFIGRYKLDLTVAILMVAIASVAMLLQPTLLSNIVQAITDDNMEKVNKIGAQLLVLAIIGLAAGILNTIFAARASQGISADVRESAYRKIQTFSFSNIEKFSVGNLVVRLTNDVTQIQNVLMLVLRLVDAYANLIYWWFYFSRTINSTVMVDHHFDGYLGRWYFVLCC